MFTVTVSEYQRCRCRNKAPVQLNLYLFGKKCCTNEFVMFVNQEPEELVASLHY